MKKLGLAIIIALCLLGALGVALFGKPTKIPNTNETPKIEQPAVIEAPVVIPEEKEPELPTLPLLGKLQFEWPMENAKITSKFGYRSDVKFGTDQGGSDASLHFGLDLIPKKATTYQAKHTKILSAADGKAWVVYPAPNGYFRGHTSFGGCVMIQHYIGNYGGIDIYAYTLYAHMSSVWVREGQLVKKGEAIGYMGNTGRTTGPHLHFEILFDPIDILNMMTEVSKEK